MPAIVYKKFAGEIPNAEPHLLPDDRAQLAENCEFTDGSLSPMLGGLLLRNMSNSPVRSIYTEDGIFFYTWSTNTSAFKSPVIGDTYNRVYINTPGEPLKVTTTLQMSPFGPSPTGGNTWNAGVPQPTQAPTLALIKRTSLPDYPSASIAFSAWYEYAGKEYDKADVPFSTWVAWKAYAMYPPTRTPYETDDEGVSTGTPEEAILRVQAVIKNGAETLASMTMDDGSTAYSSAFPGGIELSMAVVSGVIQISIKWGVVETRAYAYTWTNTWDEQGAPSPPSTIDVTYLDDVSITTQSPSALFAGYRPYKSTRFFRTFGTGSTYLEAEVSGSSSPFTEEFGQSIASTAMSSQEYSVPPPAFDGVVLMPNGWLAGFRGSNLYMSEPYRPHAWPYSMSFGKNIRGIHVGQQSLVVTTADGVHVVSGSFPASAQSIRLSTPQAGISHRSMASVDGSVVYASSDGLVFVSGTEASLAVSQKLFSRKKWRELFGSGLSTLTLGYHDGCLVGSTGSGGKGFTIRFDEDAGAFSRVSSGYDSLFFLPVNDALYYSSGSGVYQFKTGSELNLDWWGKDWIFGGHATFGAAYLRATGDVQLRLYADGVEVYSMTVSPGHFRLPSLPRGLRWSVRFTGASEIYEFAMAQTMGELKSV